MSGKRIPYLATARFDGEDAGAFLQAQLSADILALEVGGNTLACYCTPKGKVLGLLLVGRDESGFLVAANSELLPGILQRLRMYVLRSRVTISDTGAAAVSGPSGPGFGCSSEAAEMDDAEAWRAGELLAGIAWLDAASTDSYIPQMLGFENIGAVSFRKGCYPGQEIVARTHFRGATKRRMLRFESTAPVTPGDKVSLDGRDVGEVLNAIGNDLLAVVPVSHAGDDLAVNGVQLANLPLPYLE